MPSSAHSGHAHPTRPTNAPSKWLMALNTPRQKRGNHPKCMQSSPKQPTCEVAGILYIKAWLDRCPNFPEIMDPSQEKLYQDFMQSLGIDITVCSNLCSQLGAEKSEKKTAACHPPPRGSPETELPPPPPSGPPETESPPPPPSGPPETESPPPPPSGPPQMKSKQNPTPSTQPGQAVKDVKVCPKRHTGLVIACSSSDSDEYTPPTKPGGAKRRYLDVGDYPEAQDTLASMEKYYRDPGSIVRQGDPVSAETWRKINIHILMFFTYLANGGSEPCLERLEDRECVEGFLKWVQEERQLKGGTMSTYCDHLIAGLRYRCDMQGKELKEEKMFRWLTKKREGYRKDTTTSTAHHSWQSLKERRQWITW